MKERPILFNAPKARALLDDTKTQTRRWAIHIPGPDDIYAAPSQDAARHMAEKHNEAMRAWFERNPEKKKTIAGLLLKARWHPSLSGLLKMAMRKR